MAGKEQKPKQAVALSYDPDDDAPKVVATGKGALAEKIIEEAKQAGLTKEDFVEMVRALYEQ